MHKADKQIEHHGAFYTVGQIAERWQCSPKTVRRLIARGALMAHRIGSGIRISDNDLKTYERMHRDAC